MKSPTPWGRLGARLDAAGFDRRGTVLVALGGLLVLAAFTVLNWFRTTEPTGFFNNPHGFFGSGNSTFPDIHDRLQQIERRVSAEGLSGYWLFGTARYYFDWLGWTLLVSALAVGTLAASAVGASHFSVRWLGAVVSVTGVALTLAALNLITVAGNPPNNAGVPKSYRDYIAHSGFGAWFAILGFLLILVGCLIPREQR
jgi:hypothetical protein